MAKTAQEFLDHLASNDLTPPEVVESLRRQVAKATKPVSPGTLARLLVDNGHLTESQGERLAGTALPASKKSASHSGVLGLEPIGEAPVKPAKPVAKGPTKSQAEIDRAAADLGLALLPDEQKLGSKTAPAVTTKPAAPAKPVLPPKPKELLAAGIDGLMPLEELPSPVTKPAAAKAKPTVSTTPSTVAKNKAATPPVAPLVEGLAPLTALPTDDLFGSAPTADPFASSPVIPLNSPVNLADPLAAAGPLAAAPLTAQKSAAAQQAAVPRKRSKALPIIAAVVVLLLAVGGAAGYVFTRSNGDQEFQLAEQDYQAKSYDGAITKFSLFLEGFPSNSNVNTARLHRGMAKILAASPTKDNFTAMLPAAKGALGEISGEKELSQLHAELAPLLTDMAANLAEQAKQGKTAAESAEKLNRAQEALTLANDGRFVPGSLRQWQRLADVEDSLAVLERELGRSKALETALADFRKSAEGGKLDAALAERTKLLLAYPDLAGDIGLKELGKQVGKAVAAQVKSSADSSKGESAEAKTFVLGSLAFASGKPVAAAETPEQTFFARAGGSIWALDGGTGKLLWSRPAANAGGHSVTPLAADVGSYVVFADFMSNTVVCVNPRSGALKWRHSFKEPLAGEPLVIEGQVVVATTNGKIVALDAQSGNGKSAAQLPQGVRLGPTGGSGKVFVVAQHSFLYVLSPDLKCEAAVYLGHEPDSVETPPTVLSGHVIVAENRPAAALLHVIALDEKGLAAGSTKQVGIPGPVSTPPIILGERLLILTDQHSVAFDYQPGDDEPLRKLGETEASSTLPLARFGAVHADKLWIGDDGLRRFDFLPTDGTLKEVWAGFAGETLEAPPQGIADTLFCVRRSTNHAGVIATALKAASGATLWEVYLAQPLTSLSASADGSSVTATIAAGTVVKFVPAELNGNKVQFVPAVDDAVVPAVHGSLAAPTLAWAGGRLSISTSGSVELLDEKTLAPLAEPFQLSIRPGVALANCSAAATGSEGDSIVICDGGNSVYQLRLEKAPQPHLALVAKAGLKMPALSRIAAFDSSAYVVDATGAVQVLSLPELKAKQGGTLACRAVVSGPFAVGKYILVETDKSELVCLDAGGKQAWKIILADGPLAGSPLAVDGDLLLPLRNGTLLRVAAASGKEVARADLGQPLAGSPIIAGTAALVPTAAGGILKVAIPEKK